MAKRCLTMAAALVWTIGAGSSARGTDVATRITDLNPGTGHGVPFFFAAVFQNKLYFQGKDDNASESDLWVYDGLNPPSIVPGGEGISPAYLAVWGEDLWFRAGPSGDRELWRYDGVVPPTEALDIAVGGDGNVRFLQPFGTHLCFVGNAPGAGGELICWDGSSAPSVFDLRAGSGGSDPETYGVHQGKLYFDAFVDAVGDEPYSWDGLVAPSLLADVNPGTASSLPWAFVTFGDDLYFTAADDSGLMRVWRHDGVGAPVSIAPTFSVEGGSAVWRGSLYSAGWLEEHPESTLRRWNGSSFQHLAFNPGGSGAGAESFTPFAESLFFVSDVATGTDLFRICGSGTVSRSTDQFAGPDFVQSGGLMPFAGRLFFTARTATHGAELWALDADEAVFCHGFEDSDTTGWSTTIP